MPLFEVPFSDPEARDAGGALTVRAGTDPEFGGVVLIGRDGDAAAAFACGEAKGLGAMLVRAAHRAQQNRIDTERQIRSDEAAAGLRGAARWLVLSFSGKVVLVEEPERRAAVLSPAGAMLMGGALLGAAETAAAGSAGAAEIRCQIDLAVEDVALRLAEESFRQSR